MQCTIIDNFLPENVFKEIQNIVLTPAFPWYYNTGITYKYNSVDELSDYFQFTHVLYANFKPNSDFFTSIALPILEKIKPASILRIKANLLTKELSTSEHGFHTDISNLKMPCKTAVFYINTNNGYTLFEDGTKVDSVENRLVTFDSTIPHTGSSCTDAQVRCVINFNYYETTL